MFLSHVGFRWFLLLAVCTIGAMEDSGRRDILNDLASKISEDPAAFARAIGARYYGYSESKRTTTTSTASTTSMSTGAAARRRQQRKRVAQRQPMMSSGGAAGGPEAAPVSAVRGGVVSEYASSSVVEAPVEEDAAEIKTVLSSFYRIVDINTVLHIHLTEASYIKYFWERGSGKLGVIIVPARLDDGWSSNTDFLHEFQKATGISGSSEIFLQALKRDYFSVSDAVFQADAQDRFFDCILHYCNNKIQLMEFTSYDGIAAISYRDGAYISEPKSPGQWSGSLYRKGWKTIVDHQASVDGCKLRKMPI